MAGQLPTIDIINPVKQDPFDDPSALSGRAFLISK